VLLDHRRCDGVASFTTAPRPPSPPSRTSSTVSSLSTASPTARVHHPRAHCRLIKIHPPASRRAQAPLADGVPSHEHPRPQRGARLPRGCLVSTAAASWSGAGRGSDGRPHALARRGRVTRRSRATAPTPSPPRSAAPLVWRRASARTSPS
jgi:hypothetical protein